MESKVVKVLNAFIINIWPVIVLELGQKWRKPMQLLFNVFIA